MGPAAPPAAGTQLPTSDDVDGRIAAAIDGLTVRPPVQVMNLIDDSLSAPPGGPSTGDAYILSAAGSGAWSGFAAGDLVVWDGAAWQLVLAGAGGTPANGLRAIITGLGSGVAAGSFAGQGNAYALYDGGWTFQAPQDGWQVLIVGENDPNENAKYAYDSNPPGWVQSTGSTPAHNTLSGLQGGAPGEYYHLTLAQLNLTLAQKAQIALAGTEPVPTDLSPTLTNAGDWAFCLGTSGLVFVCVNIGGSYFGVELSLITP